MLIKVNYNYFISHSIAYTSNLSDIITSKTFMTLHAVVSTERKMLTMLCSVTFRDRISSSEIAERMGVESVE